MLLAGDIGGTKTRLAVISPQRGPREPLAEAVFPSADYPSLEAIARQFLDQVGLEVEQACLGVAGPVVNGRAKITNLPWIVDELQLQRELGLSTAQLLNDLVAVAHGVPFLVPDELLTLNAGQPEDGGTLAVIAPGTGLGEAFLTWDGTRYHPQASEGGHADFAPTTPLQIDLLRHLQARFGTVSFERVCSGPGIVNIYAFLKESGRAEEPAWLAERLAATDDPAPVIAGAALEGEDPCPICAIALETFVSILGAEAANLALKVLATGGVYLGGGIPPRILPALERGGLIEAFRHKVRFEELLARIPVHVILDPEAALLGAACRGLGL